MLWSAPTTDGTLRSPLISEFSTLLQPLIIFVRAPRLGFVKTRLAAAIGPEAALAAYKWLVEKLLHNLNDARSVQLRYSPDDAAFEISPWQRPGWELRPQGSGDLGDRMHRAFTEAFQEGSERVVLIGSDCPTVRLTDVEEARASLHHSDVVIGPARDGGYWLLGLKAQQPGLFQDVPWSTDRVLDETFARARIAGLRVHLLSQRGDIDTEADWRAFSTMSAENARDRSQRG